MINIIFGSAENMKVKINFYYNPKVVLSVLYRVAILKPVDSQEINRFSPSVEPNAMASVCQLLDALPITFFVTSAEKNESSVKLENI